MTISPDSLLSVADILSDVTRITNDRSFKALSKGAYTAIIQRALEQLSFESFFDKRMEVVAMNENGKFTLPKGAFNIRDIFVFNGKECEVEKGAKKVWAKENYYRSDRGNTTLSHDMGNNRDPFFPRRRETAFDDVYFYGVQNGVVILSQACHRFQNILISYNGMGADIGEEPFIPRYFRDGIVDYVCVEALLIRMSSAMDNSEFNRWSAILNIKKLDKEGRYPGGGSWDKCIVRASSMDSGARSDLKQYLLSIQR